MKESIEECDAKVEACITVEGSEDITSKSVNLFQNAVQDYTFSLQKNNSLQYTHVEENSCMVIMESLVSRNAASEDGAKVKIAKRVGGDNAKCIIDQPK